MTRSTGLAIVPSVIAILLGIALVVTFWRAVDLGSQLDDVEAERDAISRQLSDAEAASSATAYRLSRTPDGPENASGTAFMPAEGSGVLAVVNLPAAPAGQTWQLWYFRSDSEPPVPGPTFTTDASGIGYALIPADTGDFRGIGVSQEPEGGSTTPTTPMSIQGTAVEGARG